MKKRFTFLIAALMLLTMITQPTRLWGQERGNYTITFKKNSGDGTSVTTSIACSTIVSSGSGYLSGNVANATNAYYNGSNGLKLGTSNNAGVLKMNLSASGQVTPTSIVISAKRYNTNNSATLSVNGATAQTVSNSSSFNNYTFTITSPITYIQLNSSKYIWVESITVNYSSGGGGGNSVILTQSNLGLTGSYSSNASVTIEGVTYSHTDLMKSNSYIQARASTGTIYNTSPYSGDITRVAITHNDTGRPTTIYGSANGSDWSQVATGSGSITANFSGQGYKYFKITRGSNAAYWSQIEISYASIPEITVSTSSLSGFTYAHGNGPSAAQSFTVSGSNLTANITVTAPANYQVCLTENGTYANSVTLTQTSGSVSSTNVYVRLQAGLAVNASYSGNVSITSTGATSKTVGLSGSVTGYTVTYNCNGGTSGCPATPVNNVPSGSYTLASAPTKTNYTFNGWSDGTNSYDGGESYNISGNVTFTAQWTPNFPSITITPTSFDVEVAGGNIAMTLTPTNIVSPSYEVVYYETDAASVTTSQPSWLSNVGFTDNTLNITVEENDGVARSAYFKVKSGDVYSELVTVNQAAITVATPEFDVDEGTYYEDQLVDITCETNGATIYYTTDGSTPAANNGTEYDGNGVSIVEGETTLKAIAIKNNVSSSVASAEYTVVYPLTTMEEIYEAAVDADNEPADVYVTFNNWVVVYTTNNKAYVTDGQYGLVIYGSSHGFTKGKKYSGTTACKVQLYDGGAQLTSLTYAGSGFTQSDAGSVTPYEVSLATICGENGGKYLGSYVNLGTLTYNGSAFTDGENTITPYAGITLPTLTSGKTYIVKGVYYIYSSAKYITQYVEGDIAEHIAPSIVPSPLTTLAVPNYIVSTPQADITKADLAVTGSNLEADIVATLENSASSDFEISTDNSSWGDTKTITQTNGSASGTVYVRLKVGKSVADYSDRIIFTSTNATTVNVNVTGSVTYAHVVYNGNGEGVTNVPTDNTNYSYNAEVTVLGAGTMERTGYDFNGWATEEGGGGSSYAAGDNFNITEEEVTLYAKWTAKSYNLHTAAMTNGIVSFTVGGEAATTATTGQEVTMVITPATNYGLHSLIVTNETTSAAVCVSNNKFTMPASDVMVSATFKPAINDELTYSLIGVTGTGYAEWSNKYDNSDARYAGKTAGGNNSIQLRNQSGTNTPGIVTTASGGKVKKVSVVWNTNTISDRYITIYGKNEAYSGYSDLYDNTTMGTALGTIKYGTNTELTIGSDYSYIGIKASDPLYLDKITINWAPLTYTVTYNANGGSGSMSDPNSPYVAGETVTVLSNGFTAPPGYNFSQWKDGDDNTYNPDGTFTMPKKNVTLYAQWIEPCSDTPTMDDVELEAEYQSGEDRIELGMSSAITTLITGCPVTEYGFVYSTTNATPTIGGSGCTKVEIGTSYNDENTPFGTSIENAILGATYYVRSYATNGAGTEYSDVASETIESSYPTYTISYSTNGNAEPSTTVNQGNAFGTLIEPTSSYIPSGYTFVGWYNGSYGPSTTAPTLITPSYVPTGNMTLKAMFAISLDGDNDPYLEITIGNFTEITGGSYGSTYTHEYDEATVEAHSVIKNANGIQMNKNNGTYIKNTTAMPGAITKFELKWTSGTNNTIKMYANTNSEASTSSTKVGEPDATTSQSIETSINNGYRYFYMDADKLGGACYLSSFKIYYKRFYYSTSVTAPTAVQLPVDGSGVMTGNGTIPANTLCTLTTTVTIPNGKILTVNGFLGNDNPANLIVEEGGQLICNHPVAATVEKNIGSWGSKGVGGWNFIASPIAGSVDPKVAGLITDDLGDEATVDNATYDLYYLGVASNQWKNYRVTEFNLSNGQGYLYANRTGFTVDFAGEVKAAAATESVEIAAGWNLIGNPFTYNVYVNKPYYKMNNDKNGVEIVEGYKTNTIPPCTGVVVKSETSGSVTFSREAPAESANNGNINIALAQIQATRGESTAQTLDKAIVSFNEGSQLGKFYFGTQDANLYIPQDNEEYAIVSSSAQGEMPVNFKAYRDGQYTLTVNPEAVEMGYLHLIDNIAGKEVDLLANPSYSFNARNDDYESRFRLVFSANMVNADLNDDFAFFSNGQLVIANEGEAVLQVIDVTGRVVATESVNGTCSKAVNVKAGVYVLRLINGTNVKTQKIIVK